MTIGELLRRELQASELAVAIVWRPQPDGSAQLPTRAILRGRSGLGDLGKGPPISQDVVRLKVSRADVPGAKVDDRLDYAGSRFRVTATRDEAEEDPRLLWWHVTACRVAA